VGQRSALVTVFWFVCFAAGCGKGSQEHPSGKVIFASVCANCHGSTGNGGVAAAPDAAAPRKFRDAVFQHSRTDADLRKAVKEGKPPGMPAFGTAYDDKQIAELIAIVRSFDPEPK
jgi:cytochrome c oxidase cbb3-type subunit 3